MRRNAPSRHFFFGDHRNARRRACQRGEDDQLGRPIRLGDRRRVALGFDLESAPDDGEDRLARLRAASASSSISFAVSINAEPSGFRRRGARTAAFM